jgi:hypothetical protein
MLDSHSDLAIPPETNFCALFARPDTTGVLTAEKRQAILQFITTSPRWQDFRLDADELRRRIAAVPDGVPTHRGIMAFWEYYAASKGKPRWGDKSPGHIRCARKIARAIPEVRFIHIVRDGRDVAASMLHMWFNRGRRVDELAADWARQLTNFNEQAVAGRLPVHTVRYEDLVADPTPVLVKVCAFIELPYSSAMLDYYRHAEARLVELSDLGPATRADRIATHLLTREPPTTSQIGRWRHVLNRQEAERFEATAASTLRTFGYTLSRDDLRL